MPDYSLVCKNLLSALKEPEVVDSLFEKEVKKGFMIGPFDDPPFPDYRINPIGIATRKYSGKKRLIIDLSAPHNDAAQSVNSLIPLAPFSLFYATIDDAIKLIKKAGRGAWLTKADISDAFKVMPLNPSQWHLFGVKWQNKLYFSVRLTFGCHRSPKIFDTLSEVLCWILLNNCKLPFVLHLLDYFLLVDYPHVKPDRCISALKCTFYDLGVPLSEEKTLGPLKAIGFLGITLDSNLMQASLPSEKINKKSASFSKRDLLSLLGHLNFGMRIIPQGRSFIARLLDLSKSVKDLNDIVTLDEGCSSDLRFWSLLLINWNGISFFYYDELESSATLKLYRCRAFRWFWGAI